MKKPFRAGCSDVATRLHSVAIRLLRRLRTEDVELGLSSARLSALSVVVFDGPVTPGDLAAAEQVSRPTMSRLLKALESLGLVERFTDPDDRRSVRIRATAEGRRLLEQGRARRVRRTLEILAPLEGDDWELLERVVERLEACLDAPGRDDVAPEPGPRGP